MTISLKKSLFLAWLSLAVTLATTHAWAATVGGELPVLILKDQLGAPHTLEPIVRRLYINSDRKGDGLMKAAMSDLTQDTLDGQKAVVIADISGAPGFVKRIIASSLKDRRYTTWLDVTGSTQTVLPYKADAVTVVELDQRRIKAIRYLTDAEALKRELAQ